MKPITQRLTPTLNRVFNRVRLVQQDITLAQTGISSVQFDLETIEDAKSRLRAETRRIQKSLNDLAIDLATVHEADIILGDYSETVIGKLEYIATRYKETEAVTEELIHDFADSLTVLNNLKVILNNADELRAFIKQVDPAILKEALHD